jgi:DHA1 family bicyclomycin/chloramphenicol resistance-like MFS transporter
MMMKILPATWLVILLVGLPQLCETVYTPSLPDIANSLNTSHSMVEYTLSIYLLGFAIGTLFWGNISDRLGRKPCIIAGLIIFAIGCLFCYFSIDIKALLLSRFVQAFGGSIGSVLGQALCRDAFHGPALGRIYSTVSSALGVFPAIGPVIGSMIADYTHWSYIFIFLFVCAVLLLAIVAHKLPETHDKMNRQKHSLIQIAKQLFQDKNVLKYGMIVGGCNGLMFSYYAEGSFYLIEQLKISTVHYGLTFLALSAFFMLGGQYSKYLQKTQSFDAVMKKGIMYIMAGAFILSFFVLLNQIVLLPLIFLVFITIASQALMFFGICIATSNALASGLINYKWCIGAASSLFGCYYYAIVSLCTVGMGLLHNGTLFPMPLFFLSIAILMFITPFKQNQAA